MESVTTGNKNKIIGPLTFIWAQDRIVNGSKILMMTSLSNPSECALSRLPDRFFFLIVVDPTVLLQVLEIFV